MNRNYFVFFELEPKLVLNLAELQKKFYELSRKWHPDRFTRSPVAEQAEALEATAILNDAYRTLRDPVKRAEYLLAEEGFPIGEQRSKNVPPELLEEVFELNMMIEELRSGEEGQRSQLEKARENFLSMRAKIDGELQSLFQRYDEAAPEAADGRQALQEIRAVLNRRRYIENLIRDVETALAPSAATSVG